MIVVVTLTETNTSTDGANITIVISQVQQDVRKGYVTHRGPRRKCAAWLGAGLLVIGADEYD